jgi:dipeptidyl aminopeptidase/acylaminoacyl peptidase
LTIAFACLIAALASAATANAAFGGANGKIAYASDEYSLDLNIFVIPGGGGRPAVLTHSTDNERLPTWSPNGQRIAYERDRKSVGPEVWVMNEDGSGKTLLGSGGDPAWSPDGTQIAFVVGYPFELHIMNADGSGDTKVGDGAEPAWSPDGTKIAFSRDNNVYVMDATGGGEVQLTFDGAHNQSPDWSPDGSKIVFAHFTGHVQLATVSAGGGAATPLTANAQDNYHPAWSPDGTKVVFEAGWPEVDSNIRSVNADGSGLKTIRQGVESGNSEPSWQPRPVTLAASRTIVRYGGSATLQAHLYFFDSTTNTTVKIFKTPFGGSKTLVLSINVDSAGNAAIAVSPTKKTVYTVTWSGDGTHPGSSATLVVQVRAITVSKLSHYYGTSGKFRLYHAGTDLVQTGCVIPNHGGRKLGFLAERKTNGVWDDWASGAFRLSSRSCVTGVIGLPPGEYRVHNMFGGDADHLGSTSNWKYARVT